MNISRKAFLAAAMFCAASCFAIEPGFAQGAPQPSSPITDSKTSGSWIVRCYRVNAAACDIAQASYLKGRNVRIAAISIAYVPKTNAYIGRFIMPLGVSFDQGLGLEIGSYRAASLKYRRCERDGCYVEGVLPTALIAALESDDSGKGAMDGVLVDGRKFQIPIELNGFSDGIDTLKKWTLAKGGAATDKADKKQATPAP